MNGRDFHDTSRDFYDDRLRLSLWQVEIFIMISRDLIMKSRDFHDDKSRFYYEPLSFHDDYKYFD